MEDWTEEQERDFLYHYQNTHFKVNNPDNFVKCKFIRQSMFQLLQGAQKTTSNETTCHVLKTKLGEYSSVVDKCDGVNNYASGVLELVSHHTSEAQKWKSKAKASELLQDFLKPLPGECHNKGVEGCLAQRPTVEELKVFLNNKKPFPSSLLNLKKPDVRAAIPKPTTRSVQSSSLTLNNPHKRISEEMQNNIAPSESKLMGTIGSRVFGTTNRSGALHSQPTLKSLRPAKNQPQGPTKTQSSGGFRTAGTELKLQNAKKYGQQPASGGESMAYGSNKKSLGGRSRSVNSKFVPPVKSNSQEDVNSQTSCDWEGEDVDERLRLIDPKIIELISSEIMDHGPPVSWDDIAGLNFAKATIQEIVVLPMLRPDIFTGLRRPPKGILLFGPPGTGKTLIGKCIASQSKSTFFNISASSLTSKWVGEGEKMVRTLFTLARVHQPAVVFIDEIDSLLSQRSDTEHESSRRIKTEFLVQLDGAGTGEEDRILVIGATNRPQELDEAARRRLVKRLYIPLPDNQARCQLIQNLMSSERSVLTPAQVAEIALLTDGYSGADMKTLCQEACLGPIRSLSFTEMQHIAPDQVRPVTVDDFKSALSRVRSSVSPKDLEAYVTWDQTYGSGGAPK